MRIVWKWSGAGSPSASSSNRAKPACAAAQTRQAGAGRHVGVGGHRSLQASRVQRGHEFATLNDLVVLNVGRPLRAKRMNSAFGLGLLGLCIPLSLCHTIVYQYDNPQASSMPIAEGKKWLVVQQNTNASAPRTSHMGIWAICNAHTRIWQAYIMPGTPPIHDL